MTDPPSGTFLPGAGTLLNPRPPAPSTNELEQIRYALDQAAIVAITDVRGRIRYVNQKFCDISKYSREELIGQDHRILNSRHHGQEFIRDLWQTIGQGRVWRGELRNRAKDGSIYWVDTTIVPFLDERGKPWQYMAIRYDITERKQQEQHLRDQATLISLGQMAAVVAHEVRNPLAGIRGGCQLLASLLPEASEGHEFANAILARIDSLNAVMGDLLSFARLREIKPDAVDITALLSDVVSSLRFDPELRDVQWDVSVPPDLALEGDVGQLRLVFANLALNAGQASPPGSIVSVAGASDGQTCTVTIVDHGPGVPVEVRDRVFEPFFTTKHRGTGLGLPTARRVVDAHHGQLSLGDAPGRGTIATVALPLKQPH